MARLAVIGQAEAIDGFALAGALVLPAADATQARERWDALPNDIAVVILTPAAAETLASVRRETGRPLTVVLPA